jgi:hypothetical protein
MEDGCVDSAFKHEFKELVKWCTIIIGEEEVDNHFRAMTRLTSLRHFKNGISSVSQQTGAEHKEMEKVFLGVVDSAVSDARVVKAVRAALDFIFYSSLQSHSSVSLAALRQSLDDFHSNKSVFVELEGRTQPHFNIPKIHAMEH